MPLVQRLCLQKKKRTHKDEAADPSKKGPPKSFVWAHGPRRSLVKELCNDIRSMMQPHTAAKLKVSQRNVLKDFVHVAGPLGVSHFVVLTATEKASYLKLCKSPRVRCSTWWDAWQAAGGSTQLRTVDASRHVQSHVPRVQAHHAQLAQWYSACIACWLLASQQLA